MNLLTEVLMLLSELNIVKFLFLHYGYVSRVVWEKTRISYDKSTFKRFWNKMIMRGFGNMFWVGWNLNFSVEYDRAKCQEHVGENRIENRLTVWIYARNGEGWKIGFSVCITSMTVHTRGTVRVFGSTLSRTTVRLVGTTVPAVQVSENSIFCVFMTFKAYLWVPSTLHIQSMYD